MSEIKRIGVLTGGGDCSGLNAVVRAVTLTAINKYGCEVIWLQKGLCRIICKQLYGAYR